MNIYTAFTNHLVLNHLDSCVGEWMDADEKFANWLNSWCCPFLWFLMCLLKCIFSLWYPFPTKLSFLPFEHDWKPWQEFSPTDISRKEVSSARSQLMTYKWLWTHKKNLRDPMIEFAYDRCFVTNGCAIRDQNRKARTGICLRTRKSIVRHVMVNCAHGHTWRGGD